MKGDINMEFISNDIKYERNAINIEEEREIEKKQKNFLESTLGQAVNFAMDIGLRAILPDFIENQIINVKNTLMQEGLQEGIKTVINSGIEMGKSVIGIFTGNFENISQVQSAIQRGGIIESTSSLIDTVLDKIQKEKRIEKNVVTMIKQGKNILLNNINKKIEDTVTDQIKEINKIEEYSEAWKKQYEIKNFEGMEKEYKKIERSLERTIPIENILRKAREIQNIHNLIKNKGKDFEISEIEKELSRKLA
jgi:hypothetical protein